jgi:predicted RecB family nuclease
MGNPRAKGYTDSDMARDTIPQLSKSRFGAGLQCFKRLYLEYHSPELADPIEPSQQALFDTGTAVGILARQRFPEGRLIDEPYFEHSRAEASTSGAIADPLIPAIYEAAFTFDGTRTRVDILSRNSGDTFDLVEVKSSTSVKPEHVLDAAIQLHVVEGSGAPVRKVFLLHIDKSYVYEGGPYDLSKLFRLEDITGQARTFLSSIPKSLAAMWQVLYQDEAPTIEIGPQCTRPYQCPFYGYCRQDTPEHHIEQLPRARPQLMEKLRTAGIIDIRKIPPDFPMLSANQQRVRDSVVTGQPYIGSKLSAAFHQVTYPLHFLDFETFNPALPAYPGTRPYQVIPFQWSLHVHNSAGNLNHASFLHDGDGDPREAFSRSLLDAIGPEGTIVVYSGYEQTIIKQLAEEFPQHEERLLALCNRLFDLLAVVRTHCYHPDFHGSYSLKAVLPALVPDMTYRDLEIQDGSNASAAFAQMITPDTEEPERARIQGALLAYCERDTQAMVQLLKVLLSLSRTTPSQR